jgi:aspartyl-tRNA(Asn)/glutamyl-tRNA(Gln) amidotransferase subunit A
MAGAPAPRVGIPRCDIWEECAPDIADALHRALDALAAAGWKRADVDGRGLDDAVHLYRHGGIAGAECRAFLARELAEWPAILHPTVGSRLEKAPALTSGSYAAAMAERWRRVADAPRLFEAVDVLALPTVMITPPPVAELDDLERYLEVNAAALRPTCAVSVLGLCAVTLPVGLDATGMPVGLQLVAPAGRDEAVLGAAAGVEQVLGTLAPPALEAFGSAG